MFVWIIRHLAHMAFPGDINLGGIGMTTLRMVARTTEE